MSETTTLDYLVTVNAEQCYTELRKLEISLIRILGFIERMSGDPNIDNFANKIQRTIVLIRQAQIAFRALYALMAGTMGGPIGWLFAGTQIVGIGLSMYEATRGV